MIQEEWFWQMIQTITVAVTLGLIYWQIRVQTASHVVQTLTTIHSRWNHECMLRARLKVCSDWLAGNGGFDGVDEYVAEFMEELGHYVQIKAIPKKAMWEAQSWYIDHYFCMFRDGIRNVRQSLHDKNLYTRFEELYAAMVVINGREGSPAVTRADADLKRFAESEVQVTRAFLQLREEPNVGTERAAKVRSSDRK